MTRFLTFILACLLTSTAFGQSVLVNTRLYSSEIIDPDEQIQLDLREFFQLYPEPGPVATFAITMPVPDMEKKLTSEDGSLIIKEIEGPKDNDPRYMTYKLESGETYTDPFAHDAVDFVWETYDVEFTLLADEAPGTVANFITYVNDDAYTNTIVHRNESTGQVFRPGGIGGFDPLPIIQAGGWVLSGDPFEAINLGDVSDYNNLVSVLFAWIETREPIAFEQTRNNTKGTLSMARTSQLNSATSQFFINLEDNTDGFRNAYTVFGELADPEGDQPLLDQFANAPVYDLTSPRSPDSPNIFPSLPFETIPMYTPFWNYKSSYSRFSSVTVPEGNPDGVTYSWAFFDDDDEVSDQEASNRAAFDIQLAGSNLVIDPIDTGVVRVEVSGTSGSVTRSFTFAIVAYNPDALNKFVTAEILQGGKLDTWYGVFDASEYPDIIHDNHGAQFIADFGSPSVLMAYDKGLESYIYTTVNWYPYMYAYNLGQWLWYAEGTGNGEDIQRWFYLFDGDNSAWVQEDSL